MHDRDVRAELKRWLCDLHAGDSDTLVVEEMGVWSSSVRIDIAVINGQLAGYELKSERDSLERLPRQAEFYSQVFDRVFLVAAGKHVARALAAVPEWWGLIQAVPTEDGGIALRHRREARINPTPTPLAISRLLWRAEALSALEEVQLAKGWRTKTLPLLHERLATQVPLSRLRSLVRTALKRRHRNITAADRPRAKYVGLG